MTFLDETIVQRIDSEAHDVRFGRAALTFIAALLFGVGWLAARICGLVWLTFAWSFTALKVGWQEGRKATKQAVR